MKKFCFQVRGGLGLVTVLKAIVVISVWICFAARVALADYHSTGDGTAGSPYQISTFNDWEELIATQTDWDKNFVLMNDLDLDGIPITPVGNELEPFTGVFDGDNHVISNAVINQPFAYNVGIFGIVGTGAQIREVGLMNFAVTGDNNVGGLCGVNSGTIDACYANGVVEGKSYVGGLCGYNRMEWVELEMIYVPGIISACYATGSVTGDSVIGDEAFVGGLCGRNEGIISISYASGTVQGVSYVGGLCGHNQCLWFNNLGVIRDSYATGSVTGTGSSIGGLVGQNDWGTILKCYSTGSVEGPSFVGGFVGCDFGIPGTIDGFWDIDTSGQMTSAGGIGQTTAEMQNIDTFLDAGWDFVNVWWMTAGDYPHLIWELSEIPATVDVDPDTLNLKSNGRWITVFITLPAGYDMDNIIRETIAITHIEWAGHDLTYTQEADLSFTPQVGDRDGDDIPDLTVKFDRRKLSEFLSLNSCLGNVSITIEGDLAVDSDPPSVLHFSGKNTIRVIRPGK